MTLWPDRYDAPDEESSYAEHRAALDTTLFASPPALVFELEDGVLRRVPDPVEDPTPTPSRS